MKSKAKGGKLLPALCNIIGTLMLLVVIATFVPLTVPTWFGYEIYSVVSPSMEPEIPMDSVVYVKIANAAEIAEGDVIAFRSGDSIVTHRVVRNNTVEGYFTTKGDANPIEDMNPVLYADLIGRVTRHFPRVGPFLRLYTSPVGKMYVLIFALCGMMFNILASRLRARRRERLRRSVASSLGLSPEPEAAEEAAQDEEAVQTVEQSMEELQREKGKASRKRRRWLRRILMILLLVVFIGSGTVILLVRQQYKASEALYAKAANSYTTKNEAAAQNGQGGQQARPGHSGQSSQYDPDEPVVIAPITVDFEALCAVNPDVVGWIYCEGTAINYPVLQTNNNSTYLRHSYDGKYSFVGSIFVEAKNQLNFADRNTIIYGHNMQDGSMFAELEKWASQGFYNEHPEMWLLTPEQDYKIVLVAGYDTRADSDTYQIFSVPGQPLMSYLEKAVSQSDFQTFNTLDEDAHYVLLSTCAYFYTNARYVLHGMLVPVSTAGGVLK